MNNSYKKKQRVPVMFKFYLITIFMTPSLAYAYIDPSTGSVVVTAVLGFIAAIGYTFRKYYYKLKRKIIGKKLEDDKELDD